MDVPRDKNYPGNAVQCDACGGHGHGFARTNSVVDKLAAIHCEVCGDKGWLPASHPGGRRCESPDCRKPLAPDHVAIYCSNRCALDDE